ncbi:hypothetical protein C1645_782551 [Glomus cerebriforme]|uniref:Uncharacterized protein n=1 Tax=Glomus cerebriforme TaxID=658196 RepID=A0A397SJS3_9GLOM|nr:hypothetical protein C1645_782551 [Glomus cerebriforme]
MVFADSTYGPCQWFRGCRNCWSSFITSYNPRNIVNNLKRLINDEEPIPMHP